MSFRYSYQSDRAELLRQMAAVAQWDMLVIGGGASGLGIALEAASRGYSVLLLEQHDFAKGTSSRSTKLVHGGVRYLAQGHLKLVREASVERALLLHNAPHLVRNQSFIIPVYHYWDCIKYTLGLKLYDWMAGSYSLGGSSFISKTETIRQLPGIRTQGLLGGVLYHDGQFDDARLAMSMMQTIYEQEGMALNYMRVKALLKDANQRINGVVAEDVETGCCYECKAKIVVNATGVFTDDILFMDNALAAKTLTVSQGVHIVVDKQYFPSAQAMLIPHTTDGRVLFAVPWHNKVLLGTTDTPMSKALLEPVALEEEIDLILTNVSKYLNHTIDRTCIDSVFAGLRPLAAEAGKSTREISRSHKIYISDSGLCSIVGGKWTTYRKMADDMLEKIEKHFGCISFGGVTKHLLLHGSKDATDWNDPFYYYGTDAAWIHEQIYVRPDAWISKADGLHTAQVEWAVANEMARTVEDILARRVRLLFLNAKAAMALAPAVAAVLAQLLHKDEHWQQMQVETFNKTAAFYLPCHDNAVL